MAVKLYVIAGHGNGDSGALGWLGGHMYQEADLVRVLANRIKAIGGDYVELGPLDRNPYEDEALANWFIPKGCQVVELHMDSFDNPYARGGHVAYKAGLAPDEYDMELARRISAMFPGRSSSLVGYPRFQNVNQAAARGIPYRLVENCFISNEGDLAKFLASVDDIARMYLEVFGIATVENPVEPVPEVKPAEGTVAEMQRELNKRLSAFQLEKVKVTGVWDSQTQTGIVRLLQASHNYDFDSQLVVDGVSGGKTRASVAAHPVGIGYEDAGNDVWAVKAALVGHGHEIDVATWAWDMAEDAALRVHQRAWGLDDDGVCGPLTWATLISAVNV